MMLRDPTHLGADLVSIAAGCGVDLIRVGVMAPPRRPKPSFLIGMSWRVPDIGVVRVATATPQVAEQIDKRWTPNRRTEDTHLAWRWAEIVPDMREAFVVTADDEPLAIWSSKLGSPITLEGARYYRLDYLEIDPTRRGDGVTSALLFMLIAKRVAEHSAMGMVMAAFQIPGLVETYAALGAERGTPRGWNHPAELVPLTFRQATLDRLRKLIDDLQENPS